MREHDTRIENHSRGSVGSVGLVILVLLLLLFVCNLQLQ